MLKGVGIGFMGACGFVTTVRLLHDVASGNLPSTILVLITGALIGMGLSIVNANPVTSPVCSPESQPIVSPRKIDKHKVNPMNDLVDIAVMDAPGLGGANHSYMCYWAGCYGVREIHINFQNGPIKEEGVNGLTHEVLLAIVEDRLQSFQTGPYACEENAKALKFVQYAQKTLQARTKARMKRGVEGTLKA